MAVSVKYWTPDILNQRLFSFFNGAMGVIGETSKHSIPDRNDEVDNHWSAVDELPDYSCDNILRHSLRDAGNYDRVPDLSFGDSSLEL